MLSEKFETEEKHENHPLELSH